MLVRTKHEADILCSGDTNNLGINNGNNSIASFDTAGSFNTGIRNTVVGNIGVGNIGIDDD